MPELPEVETMVRGLRPVLEGRRLGTVQVLDPSMLQGCTSEHLEGQARDARVDQVTRRGKWVVLALEAHRGWIVIQPRMTGGFWLVEPTRPEHIRLIIRMDGSPDLVWFCDTRRLGKIAWYADAERSEAAFARSHGPDALEICRDELANRLKRTSRGIKATLMDQKVLAGIGNIYADEILFRSGLHPEHAANRLSPAEVTRLHGAVRPVLEEAIAAEGSSFDAGYRTVLGLEGGFLAQNAVHRRQGQSCPRCGGAIVKTRINGLIGRTTYFCPNCQPLRGNRRLRGSAGRNGGD